jgi:hypothetical protein
MNITKLIIVLLLVLIIILFTHKLKNKEHMSSNEALQTLVSVYNPTKLTASSANFEYVKSNKMDLSGGIIKATNGIFNYLKSNELDVSSNLTANTGTFNTITSNNIRGNITGETARFNTLNVFGNIYGETGSFSQMNISGSLIGTNGNFNTLTSGTGTFNNLTSNDFNITGNITGEIGTFTHFNSNNINGNIYGETGRFTNMETLNEFKTTNITSEYGKFNNIISSEISGNYISGNTATFNNLKTNNLNIINNNFNTVSANNFCFGPNTNDCISVNSFNLLQLLNSPLYNYMYLPNTITEYGIPPTIVNDQNVIWSDISGYITTTIRPNAPIKNIPANISDVWQISNDVSGIGITWNGITNTTLWYGIPIYRTLGMSSRQNDDKGIQITVPLHPNRSSGQDYSVLWLRLRNHNFQYFKVYELNGTVVKKYFGKHTIGKAYMNHISPDGSIKSDEYLKVLWWPVPIDLSGNSSRNIMINSFVDLSNNMWIGGVAFSTNPWNHCLIHGNSLYNHINDDNTLSGLFPDTATIKNFDAVFNETYLFGMQPSTSPIIRIPFVNSGRNKIFYIIENNNTFSLSIVGVEINITPNSSTPTWQNIGNFYTTFDNPFARHSNSMIFHKYYGIIIPKEYLPVKGSSINDNFMQLRITIPAGLVFKFSDVGTHDVNPFE